MKNGRTTRSGVKHVKFTPEEMAFDPSAEETERWPLVGRGPAAVFAKPAKSAPLVPLDPDVAAVFQDAPSVNRALCELIEAMPAARTGTRKTA